MEICHFVICCVLFMGTLCFSTLDATRERLSLDANIQSECKCENGDCVTDKLGHSKCVCKQGFALQDEFTCKPCECGSLGKCIFILTRDSSATDEQLQYKKKCVCDVGKAEKDGVCVDCDCGKNSACDFDQGERRCYCIDGYSEKDGVCTKCDCGFNGQCEYENGNKKCECDEGYLELNGVCKECDCGENGTCSFVNGQPTCRCEPGFRVNDGKCEPCDCGSNSESCAFVDGVKQCKCNDRYADRFGTCEECYCGEHTTSCNFKDNQKTCGCSEGYMQKGESCELGCSDQKPCQNGGYCKGGFCFCQNGTRGEFCDEIDGCSNLCPNQGDVKCAYDAASQKAICTCLDSNLIYDSTLKKCKRGCVNDNDCQNGGKCGVKAGKKICTCLLGTQGDKCEIVNDCSSGRVKCSGDNAYCGFDVNMKKATCKCKNSNEVYDFRLGTCRYFCRKPTDCFNGGRCVNGGFCVCPYRTHGARCEIVDDCYFGLIRCYGSGAYCAYDVRILGGNCFCKNRREFYSFWFGRCLRKWWSE